MDLTVAATTSEDPSVDGPIQSLSPPIFHEVEDGDEDDVPATKKMVEDLSLPTEDAIHGAM